MYVKPRKSGKELLLKIIKKLFFFVVIPFILLSVIGIVTLYHQVKDAVEMNRKSLYCIKTNKGEKLEKIETIETMEDIYGDDYDLPEIKNVWVSGIKDYQSYMDRQRWEIKYIDASKKKTTFNLEGKEVQAEVIYYIDFTIAPRYDDGAIFDYKYDKLGCFYISFYKEKDKYIACYHFYGNWYRLALIEDEKFEMKNTTVSGIKDYKEYMDRQAWVIKSIENGPKETTLKLDEQEVFPEVVYYLDYGEIKEKFDNIDDKRYYPMIFFCKEEGQDTYTAYYRFGYRD